MLVKVIIKAEKEKLINVLAIIHFIYSHRRVQRKSHKNIEIRKTFHIFFGSNERVREENRKKSQKINREK